jgi:hypothetical protein
MHACLGQQAVVIDSAEANRKSFSMKKGRSFSKLDVDPLSPIHEQAAPPNQRIFFGASAPIKQKSFKATYSGPVSGTDEDLIANSPVKTKPEVPPLRRGLSRSPSFNARFSLVRNESKLAVMSATDAGTDDAVHDDSDSADKIRVMRISENFGNDFHSKITDDDHISKIVKGSDDMIMSQKKIEYIVEAIQEVSLGHGVGATALQTLILNTPRLHDGHDTPPLSLSRQNSKMGMMDRPTSGRISVEGISNRSSSSNVSLNYDNGVEIPPLSITRQSSGRAGNLDTKSGNFPGSRHILVSQSNKETLSPRIQF